MSDDPIPPTISPPAISLPDLFLKFLGFGCLAFGGPVAQIAMIRQSLVEDERWISGARFNRLLGVMQVLPGPEAHELCVHMGMMARGRIGGLLAGLGFMLPGLVLMLLLAWAYVQFVTGEADFAGVLLGVQVVVLAVIARAVQRIGTHVLVDRTLVALAIASALAALAGVPFWVSLILAGIAYALSLQPVGALALVGGGSALAWLAMPYLAPLNVTAAIQASHSTTAGLFIAGLKGGLLTFGGAYTAIPYVRHDTVGRGWISDPAFLDGVALAGVLPAPLVIFGTFVGYVAGGLPGALALTAGMFLPAFGFSMIFFERLETIVHNVTLHRLLDGLAAAVVGTIVATLLQLAAATLERNEGWPFIMALFVLALLAAWRLKGKWVTPTIVVFGATAGWVSDIV